MLLNKTCICIVLTAFLFGFGCAPTPKHAGAPQNHPINTYEKLLLKQSFALEAARRAEGAVVRPVKDPDNLYAPVEADISRGLVFYQPSLITPFKAEKPAPEDVKRCVTLRAAGGETESALLTAWALKPAPSLMWSIKECPKDLGKITIEILPVLMSPLKRSKSNAYDILALWAADAPAPVDVPEGKRFPWLVRISVPEGTPSGTYQIPLLYTIKGGSPQKGPVITLTILPFNLVDPWEKNYVFGAFCAGADFSTAQYRQMKAHGIEAILWFWGHYGLDVLNESGKLSMDFTALDKTVNNFKQAGMRGPIVLGLGNDSCGHFEREICRKFNLPMQPQVKRRKKTVKLAVLDNKKIEEFIIEALRQLFEHAKNEKWPEIVIMPYDEPTERLMNEHKRMVRIFRTHFPKIRLYGCSMNKLGWAKQVSDCDIIVSNGSFGSIRNLTREKKIAAWFYGGSTAAHGFQSVRWRFGLQRYVFHPDGSWFWSYNFHTGDPWTEFDGPRGDSAWVICWPPLGKGAPSVNSIPYEGMREGVDDVRYAMTLESMLADTDLPAAQKIKEEYDSWCKEARNIRPGSSEIPEFREKLINFIMRLKNRTETSIKFRM